MPDRTKVEAYTADRERLNELAAQLTADGPGKFGQADTLKWLLDTRDAWVKAMAAHLGAGEDL